MTLPDHITDFNVPRTTTRFMFTGGRTIDATSQITDSRLSEHVLTVAERLWGKDKDRRIVGQTVIHHDQRALDL